MRHNVRVQTAAAVCFWLLFWQAGAVLLDSELLLSSPLTVLRTLAQLVLQNTFWQSIAASMAHILAGFALGTLAGVLLAAASSRYIAVRVLLAPPVRVLRATPVASFVILALLWVESRNLSVFITFVMVQPVLYTNVLQGLDSRDQQLDEMTTLFRVGAAKKLRFVTLPALLPWLIGGCRTAIGLAWKSGVAAEVIGLPRGSIGERLYQAKLYLETGELFAWTLVIILLSTLCEKLLVAGLCALQRRLAA
ncbi:MAG: ABC transporter permease subunit [Pygmaiobacter sp.]